MIAEFMVRYGSKWFAGGFALTCLSLITWMLTSPIFRIDHLVIVHDPNSSTALLDETEVLTRLAWVNGKNVFQLDTREVAKQVEAEPSVKWAEVEASIDGQLRVFVTYRRPVANWNVAGKSYLVGKEAILLAEGSDSSLSLTIEEIGGETAAVGQQVNPDALEVGHKLRKNLPIMGIEPTLITYSAAGGFLIRDVADREIIFGPPENLMAKLIALKAVLDDAARQGNEVSRIDLRPLERPTYQIRES